MTELTLAVGANRRRMQLPAELLARGAFDSVLHCVAATDIAEVDQT